MFSSRESIRSLRAGSVLMLGVWTALLVLAGPAVSHSQSGLELWRVRSQNKVDEARRLEELEQIAEGLRAAVLRKDSDSLLNYYWRDAEKADPWSGAWAVANADGAGTYESERRALADRTSAPFCLLFDSTCRRAMAEPEHRDDPSFRISVRDFFLKGPVTTEIFFRGGPDVTQVDLDRAVLVYVRTGSPASKFSRLQDFEFTAPDKWGREFLWVEIALTRFGWRYERVLFGFPYDGN